MMTTAPEELVCTPTFDVETRSVHTLPTAGDGFALPTQLVTLHHPGWDDKNLSALFALPTCSLNRAQRPCIEYLVASQACYIIALNQTGFFTIGRDRSSERATPGQALTTGHYWYHLDEKELGEQYPTISDFRQWRYDPEKVPVNWASAVPWAGRADDDQTEGDCCITGEDFVQNAHLIPKTEWKWWMENDMTDHAGTSGVTRATTSIGQEMDVPGNIIALSDGLHRLWDNDFFCLFPLNMEPAGDWRLHCIFMRPLQKVVRNHHRRPLRGGLAKVSAACAWSRFAFTVIRKYEATFLTKSASRQLRGSSGVSRWVDAREIADRRQQWVRNTSPTKKSRSSSRRKRDRSRSSGQEQDSAVEIDSAFGQRGRSLSRRKRPRI